MMILKNLHGYISKIRVEEYMELEIKNSFVVIIAAIILLPVPLGLAYMNVSDFDNYIINRLVVGELIKWR